jgi:hypothetical protein
MSEELTALISKYTAPKGQISLLFNVPMDQLATVKKVLQGHFKNSKDTYNIRWRGPRHTSMQQSTLKKDAVAFSVYVVPKRCPNIIYEPMETTPPKFVMVNGYQYKLA